MLAERMSRLGTETAFEVLARAKAMEAQGRDVVHLEIGEPDFDTPVNIREAAKKAIDEGFTHYGPSAGMMNVKEAFAEFLTKDRGLEVRPENIVVTPGAKPILFFTILALVDKGDEVIYPNPGFPIYESVINFVGGKPVPIPLREEKAFSFDLDEMRSLVNDKTKLIIINSPQNPTGGVLTSEDMKGIAELAEKHDAYILSDEVYSKMVYDGKHVSIYDFPEVRDRVILLEGHSKTYAMTGWRLGYASMNPELAGQISKLQTNSNSCTAAFTQIAGVEALFGPQDASLKMMAEFKARRDLIVEGLNDLPGFSCLKPKGAFYVFPNITGTGRKSKELEEFLLDEAGVAGLSGTSFGKYGEGYLRFSYANSQENLKKALDMIRKVL